MPKAATVDRRTIFQKIRDAISSKNEKEIDAALCEAEKKMGDEAETEGEGSTAHHIEIHNHAMPGEGEKEKTGDSKRIDEVEKKMEDGFKRIGDTIADLKKALDKKGGGKDDDPDGSMAGDRRDEKIEGELEAEAPEGTGDKARKAKDSAWLEESFTRTVADAEILAPGIRIPTFDRKLDPTKTFDSICQLRRRALDVAMLDPTIATFISNLSPSKTFDTKKASCADTRSVFGGVVAFKRQNNNNSNFSAARVSNDGNGQPKGAPQNIGDLNKLMADRRAAKMKTVAGH